MTANAVLESSCWPADSQADYWKTQVSAVLAVFLFSVSSPALPASSGPAVTSGSPAVENGFDLVVAPHVVAVQDLAPWMADLHRSLNASQENLLSAAPSWSPEVQEERQGYHADRP